MNQLQFGIQLELNGEHLSPYFDLMRDEEFLTYAPFLLVSYVLSLTYTFPFLCSYHPAVYSREASLVQFHHA